MSTDSNTHDVHDLLIQLHHELKRADTISERDQALFDHLADHLQEVIDKPESPHEPLTARLEAALTDIETTHPTLAGMMERVVSGLSNMGI
jgi:hypothetical protein